jgi:hypothetical protein
MLNMIWVSEPSGIAGVGWGKRLDVPEIFRGPTSEKLQLLQP